MCRLQILSPSLWLIFSLSWQSVTVQENLILMKSSLSILSFMDHAYGVLSKKSPPYQTHLDFSPMFSYYKSFIVLHFTLIFVFHFELFFVLGVRLCLHWFFDIWISRCFNIICWKDYLFPIGFFWRFLKDQLTLFT